MVYHVYQRVDNKWKDTVLGGEGDLCETLQSKIKLQRIFFDYSNFPKRCPVLKVCLYMDPKYSGDILEVCALIFC